MPAPIHAAPRQTGAVWRRARAAACAALCATACNPPGGTRLPATSLVAGVAQPRLGASADGTTSRVAALLGRASLLRLDRACRPEPALAERVEISADGRTYTLTLRAGLTFHDGSPLDASAVAALIAANVRRGGPVGPPPGLRDVEQVVPVGAVTVRVSLRHPAPLLPEALAGLEVRGGRNGDSGAGPFVRAREKNGTIEMAAFRGHYLGPPSLDRVVLQSFQSPRTAWAALLRDEVGLLYEVSPDAVPLVRPSRAVQVRSFLRPFVYVVGFNVRHPVLRDPRVRRALSLSVDRAGLVRRVLDGRARLALDPVWPVHWTISGEAPDDGFDVGQARRALDEAGLPFPRALRQSGAPPARFAFKCLVPSGIPLLEALAVSVQRDLFDAGVHMQLEAVPLHTVGRRLAAGEFDAYLLDVNGFGLSWTYWLWHSVAARPFIDSGYRGADAALDRVRHATSESGLRDAVDEVRRTLRDDPPGLFLCWLEASRAVSRRFALPPELDRDVLLSLARWQPAPETP